MPERAELSIQGERVVVLEFRDRDRAWIIDQAAPLLADLHELAMRSEGIAALLVAVWGVLQKYPDEFVQLLARACERDLAWIEKLRSHAGERLQMAFMAANAAHLLRLAMNEDVRRHLQNIGLLRDSTLWG